MKILLVSVNTLNYPFYTYPIGMSVVANILQSDGHSVKQFDFLANGMSFESFAKQLDLFKPDIVGISIRNADPDSIENAKKITSISKEKKYTVIAGGTALGCYNDLIQKTGADFGFIGPAESNLINFINNFKKGILPDTKLINFGSYKKVHGPLYDANILNFYAQKEYAVSINTKRGCKYNCFYCVYPYLDGKICRYREIDDIIEDFKLLEKYNVKNLFFSDSIVNDDNIFFIKLLKKMTENKININWSGYLRPEHLNDEVVYLLKKSGLTTPILSIDASTDQTLLGMQKGFTWQDVINVDNLFVKHKISCDPKISSRASFIFGGPMETKETVLEGIQNIKNLHFTNFDIFIFETIFICGSIKISKNYKPSSVDENWLKQELIKAFGTIGGTGYIRNSNI